MTPEEERTQYLRHLYAYDGVYYILVNKNGGFVYEHPDSAPEEFPRQSRLRLFMAPEDALRYRSLSVEARDIQVHRIALDGLWHLLPQLKEVCLTRWGAPLCVDVSVMRGGEAQTVDVLHGAYVEPS